MFPSDPFAFVKSQTRAWLDPDEITQEDLKGPLTAEQEVLDWMAETPVPRAVRPSWLPDDPPAPRPAAARAPDTARRKGSPWALRVALTAGATGALTFGVLSLAVVALALR